MFLSKKDTPKQYQGMFIAGMLNLGSTYFNLAIALLTGSILSLVLAVISLVATIVIYTVIKQMATKMLWSKLTQKSNTGFS